MKRLLIVFLSIFIAASAYADTCATKLQPMFTDYQAKLLCSRFSAGTIGTLANNTYAVARNAANSANINVWKVDGTDDTVIDADSGDIIKFAMAGTQEGTVSTTGISVTAADDGFYATDGLSVSSDVTTAFPAARSNFLGLNNTIAGLGLVTGAASTAGAQLALMKSRATDGTADTIVANGDALATLTAYGADGADFETGGRVQFEVSAAPGSDDMPTDMVVYLSPDGSATLAEAMRVTQAKNVIGKGEITSASTGSLGWSYVTGANTACTTTCTSAAVFGVDLAAGASAPVIVGPSAATADACVCAGAS